MIGLDQTNLPENSQSLLSILKPNSLLHATVISTAHRMILQYFLALFWPSIALISRQSLQGLFFFHEGKPGLPNLKQSMEIM